MKKCPVCNRTYADETQNFCLEDGATLVAANFGAAPGGGQQQRKKSNPLLWILGIIAAIVVIGGAGLLGLLFVIGKYADNNNNSNNRSRNVGTNAASNRNLNFNSSTNRQANTNSGNNFNSNSSAASARLKYSEMDWGVLNTEFGRGEYIAGEYQVNSKKSDNYYVIVVDSVIKDEYVTKNAIAKVTARSITGVSPYVGYGLVVHSDPTPLETGYAFIIRADKEPAFRVAKHDNRVETDIVKWTPAKQIRTGTQPNELEVRSDGKTLQFYINGQFATSIADNITSRGIVGVYTSGTPVVAFSDLRIYDNR